MTSYTICNIRKNALLALAFIVCLAGLSFADACSVAADLDFSSAAGPTSLGSNWKTLSGLGILISVVLAAIVFMVGKMLESPEIQNRARSDLMQTVITIVILAIFSLAVLTMCNFNAKQFGLPDGNLFNVSKRYFSYASSISEAAYIKTLNTVMFTSALSSIYFSSPIYSYMFFSTYASGNPLAGLSAVIGAMQLMMNFVMMQVIAASSYNSIFTIIETYFLNLFLPLGVVLRCFTPTRSLGGILIAIAIGMFLFYPLLFSFAFLMFLDSSGSFPADVATPSADWESGVTAEYITVLPFTLVPGGYFAYFAARAGAMEGQVANRFIDAMATTGDAALKIFIVPAIMWIVLAMVIRDMSRALGEEVDVSALSRLI
jgi:hypothetical protein